MFIFSFILNNFFFIEKFQLYYYRIQSYNEIYVQKNFFMRKENVYVLNSRRGKFVKNIYLYY